MAGDPFLVYEHQHGIPVAVEIDFLHILNVSGFLALHPEPPAGPAPEMGSTRFEGLFEGFPVGVGEHQHLPVLKVLHYNRSQSFFVVLNLIEIHVVSSGNHNINQTGITFRVPGRAALHKRLHPLYL